MTAQGLTRQASHLLDPSSTTHHATFRNSTPSNRLPDLLHLHADLPTPQILHLLDYFKSTSRPTIFTQHGHPPSELTRPASKSPNQLVRKWGISNSIARGSDDWTIIPELHAYIPPPTANGDVVDSKPGNDNSDGDGDGEGGCPKVVQKNTYDAFLNTELEGTLTEGGVKRVVVTGVMTDCCCDTTARAAFNRGWETWLVKDACGSNGKQQHGAGLKGFGFAFGEVLGTKEVVGRLKREEG